MVIFTHHLLSPPTIPPLISGTMPPTERAQAVCHGRLIQRSMQAERGEQQTPQNCSCKAVVNVTCCELSPMPPMTRTLPIQFYAQSQKTCGCPLPHTPPPPPPAGRQEAPAASAPCRCAQVVLRPQRAWGNLPRDRHGVGVGERSSGIIPTKTCPMMAGNKG